MVELGEHLQSPVRGDGRFGNAQGAFLKAADPLYRSLFTGTLTCVVASSVWGVVDVVLNGRLSDVPVSAPVGVVIALGGGVALWYRTALFTALRHRPLLLLIATVPVAAALALVGRNAGHFTPLLWSIVLLGSVVADSRVRLGVLLTGGVLGSYVMGSLAVRGLEVSRLNPVGVDDELARLLIVNCGLALVSILALRSVGRYLARLDGSQAECASIPLAPVRCSGLTPREIEVVQRVAAGQTNQQIGTEMFLSPRTVQTHVTHALQKTGASGRVELAVLATREGICSVKA